MIHAFMLVVVMGTGDFRKVQPDPMYFRSIDVCQYYAKAVPRQYGNYSYISRVDARDRIIAVTLLLFLSGGLIYWIASVRGLV